MARDQLQLMNGKQLNSLLEELGPKIAKRARRTGFNKAALQLKRSLIAGARPLKDSGVLERAIGIRRGRSSRWVGLNKPVVATSRRVGRRGGGGSLKGSGVPYYYKALDLVTAKGAPTRPWFERAVNAARPAVQREMLNGARKAIRTEAGRMHAASLAVTRGSG